MSLDDEVIRGIVRRCDSGQLDAADVALARSWISQVADPVAVTDLVNEAADCRALLAVVADEALLHPARPVWTSDVLITLSEGLLFGEDHARAELVIALLRRRIPTNPEVIRLWALAAPTPEDVMQRFVDGLVHASPPEALLRFAREYALQNEPRDLGRAIEAAASRLGLG